jgi:hypothetical protein
MNALTIQETAAGNFSYRGKRALRTIAKESLAEMSNEARVPTCLNFVRGTFDCHAHFRRNPGLISPLQLEGENVKLKITATLTSLTVGATLVLGGSLLMLPKAQGAQEQCSVAKLQGRYVFTGQGSNLHYGAFDFDGAGKFLGKQTSVRYKTSVQREALSGTYTLDTDCTGTMTLEGQLGGPAHWDVFVTSDGKKGRMIRTDADTTGVRTFEQ